MQKSCKHQNEEKHFCRNAAKPRNFFEVFAGVPQISRKTFWRLRESRKSLEKLFGLCGSPASLPEYFLAFAGVPQVPRKTFWSLRESRKCPGKLFGVYGSPASLSENFLVPAGVPQVPRKTFWPLRESRKSLGKLFGVCGIPASIYKVGGLQDGERKCALEPSIQKLNVCIFASAFRRASNPC